MVKEKREKAKRRFYGKTGKNYFLHSLQLFSHVTQLKEWKGRNLMCLDFLLFIKKYLKEPKKKINKESNSFFCFVEDIFIKNECFFRYYNGFLLFDLYISYYVKIQIFSNYEQSSKWPFFFNSDYISTEFILFFSQSY